VRINSRDRSAIVDLPLKAEVDSELKDVRAAEVSEVVDELEVLDGAIVAELVLRGRIEVRRWKVKRRFVERGGLNEQKRVLVVANDELIGDASRGSPAPVEGQVARFTNRINQTGRAGEDRQPPIHRIAVGVLAAPGAAEEHSIGAAEIVVDLDHLVV